MSCLAGCLDRDHLHECPRCGLLFHFGLSHGCPTNSFGGTFISYEGAD